MSLTVRPTLRDAAQQAYEALHLIRDGATGLYGDDLTRCNLALEMLSAALAEDDPETTPQPVAYISGYNKGRCIIEAVDREWLLPVGMALYRSPLTSQESRQVEPVAYCTLEQLAHLKLTVPSEDKIAIYTAPPTREPLRDEEIEEICWTEMDRRLLSFARAIERAHGIGGEE